MSLSPEQKKYVTEFYRSEDFPSFWIDNALFLLDHDWDFWAGKRSDRPWGWFKGDRMGLSITQAVQLEREVTP